MRTRSRTSPAVRSGRLRGLVFLTAVAACTVAIAPVTPASAVASAPRIGFQGQAFGTLVSVAGKVKSGRSALIVLGCGVRAGFSTSNSAATATLGTTLSSANLATTGSTSASPDRTATTARAEQVSLLGGAVTATAVKAVSISTHDSSGYHTSAAGSTFTGLKVLGTPIAGNPAPNTTISLPGMGHVVLNEQRSSVNATSAKLTVRAIHAYVSMANPSGIPVNTNAIVAAAVSAILAPTGGFLRGVAYGSMARVGAQLSAGPSFPAFLPCTGTRGNLLTNTGAAVMLPGLLAGSTIKDTAKGSTTSTTATGETTSTVTSANLVNGRVKATLIKADAHATRANGSTSVSSTGSGFGSIIVNGKTLIPANIKANTVMQLAGVGTLYLRRTIVTPTSIEVRMIELVVTANSLGIPVGTDVRVAVALVGARS